MPVQSQHQKKINSSRKVEIRSKNKPGIDKTILRYIEPIKFFSLRSILGFAR